MNTCRRKQAANTTNVANNEEVGDKSQANGEEEISARIDLLHWNNNCILIKDVNHHAYQKIVYWQKNLLKVPTGAAGKMFINETTTIIHFWTDNLPLHITLHIMPALLLQNPSQTSKSKDHLAALSRHLELWDNGEISELLYEGTTIKERLSNGNNEMNIVKISSKFKDLMQKFKR